MNNVTKQHLVQEASRTSGHPQIATREVAEAFMRVVGERLAAGDSIEIRGFGTFYAKERKPRPARNPRTGEICPLGKRRVPLFRFSPDVLTGIGEIPELQEALERSHSESEAFVVEESEARHPAL